jgi:TM2 domain-containing membrane protein YozV
MKNKTTAGLLALFLGGIGAHKFYVGKTAMGIVYLCFCWTFIPAVISLVEAILFLTASEQAFNLKYNAGLVAALPQQNIVVNVQNTTAPIAASSAESLKALHDLKVSGALTEEEFAQEKRKLLGSG